MGSKLIGKQLRRRVRSSRAMGCAAGEAVQPLEKRVLFAAFTPGDLVVYRVGTGAAALSTASTAVFVDEYTPAGALVQSIALPTATSGSNNPLTASGTAQYEGELSLSQDGQNLLLTGYDTTTGTASVTTSATILREVGVVNASGGVNTTTTLGTGLESGNVWGAGSVDGVNGVYATGSKGIVYTPSVGSTANATSLTAQETYGVQVFGGQVYITPYNNSLGVSTVGTGLPTTTGQSVYMLNGETFSGTEGKGVGYSREFAFASLNGSSGTPDTLYVADAYNDGIDKLSLIGTSWQLTGTIGGYPTTTLAGIEGIVARPTAGGEQLIFTLSTTATGGGDTLDTITDPYGFNYNGGSGANAAGGVFSQTPHLTVLATASTNENFRGLALVPQPSAISVFTQPTPVTAVAGTTAAFTAQPGGANATVQWQVSTGSAFTNITNNSNYSGATSTTLNVLNVSTAEAGYQFQAVFTNPSGSVTTNPAALSVIVVPAITSVSPNAIPTSGGTITIAGSNLNGSSGAAVYFNGSAGTITADTGTSITVTAPPESAGSVNVTVNTSSGSSVASSAITSADVLVYGPPTITGLSSTSGVDSGGTTITISGSGFVSGANVSFGSVAATNVVYNASNRTLTATVPAAANGSNGSPTDGAVSVVVTTGGGSSAGYSYTYIPTTIAYAETQPNLTILTLDSPNLIITSILSSPLVSPINGRSYSGWAFLVYDGTGSADIYGPLPNTANGYNPTVGDIITVTGTWSPFDQIPELETLTNIAVVSSGNALPPAVSPPPIEPIATLNTSNLASVPAIQGYLVTVQGVEISNVTDVGATSPTTSFDYNNSLGTITDTSGNMMQLYYYPSSYSVANTNLYGPIPTKLVDITGIIQVTTGATAQAEFVALSISSSSLPPIVKSVTPPAQGGTGGGETVTINGYGFQDGISAVTFGSNNAPSYTIVSDNVLTAIAPSGSGTVNITVSDANGTSATSSADLYTYTNNPVVSAVSPSAGPLVGNNSVTITGSNFVSGDTVKFGGNASTGAVTVNSPNSITVTAPAEAAGTVNVTVTAPGMGGATSAVTAADQYTYTGPPVISSMNVSGGAPTGIDNGGTSVVITGTGFVAGTTVTFDGIAAAKVTITSPTLLTAVTPKDTGATAVAVVVSSPFGNSSSATFTYTPTTIAAAEALPTNTIVTLDSPNLVVTSILAKPGYFNGVAYAYYSVLINDGTGSLDLFATALHPLPDYTQGIGGTLSSTSYAPTVGDIIQVTGSLAPYNQIPEFTPVTAVTLVTPAAQNTTVIPPGPLQGLTIANVNVTTLPNSIAGYLVQLNNVTIVNVPAGVTQFGTINIQADITDSSTTKQLEFYYWPSTYSLANAYFDGLDIPTGPVNLIGFMSVYNSATPEFIPVAIAGGSPEKFTISTSATPASVTGDPDGFSTVNRGTGVTVTVTRSETADAASVMFNVNPDSAVDTQDYNVSMGSLNSANGVVSGILNFAIGQATATFTVDAFAIPTPLDIGDKIFTVSLSNASGGSGYIPFISGAPAAVVIHDTSTAYTISPSSFEENANVTPKGVAHTNGSSGVAVINATGGLTPDAGLTNFDVEANNNANGNSTDFGVLTYNDWNNPFDPNDPATEFNNVGPYGNDGNPGSNTIAQINGIEIETTDLPATYDISGPLNVYLVTNTTVSIANGSFGSAAGIPNSPLIFDKANDSTGGIFNQLGSKYLLGTIQYNANQSSAGYTPFNLTNLDPSGIAALESALNSGAIFRIAVAPGNSTVTATFVGSTEAPSNSYILQSPILRINYSTTISSLPWLQINSGTPTWDGNNLLITSGSDTIIADPQTYGNLPHIYISGGASLTIAPTSANAVHLGGLNISGGATVSVNASTGTPLLVSIADLSALSITGGGKFNMANSYVDFANGNLPVVDSLIVSGGIVSSTVTASQTQGNYLTGIGAITDVNAAGTLLYSSFDGAPASATDVLMITTYLGDANLSGAVDGSDYSLIDNGALKHLTGWFNGDFNYDGVINGSDYTLIDNAYNQQGPGFLPAVEIAAPRAENTAVPQVSMVTDSLFSKKKVRHSLVLEDLVTH